MNPIIREAAPQDARAYIRLMRAILNEQPPVDAPYDLDEFDPPQDAMAARIAEMYLEPNSIFLVAAEDGNPDLLGVLTCGGKTLHAERHVTELGLFVARAQRGNGVGSALMARCMAWARENPHVSRVALEVYAQNARAIHVYEKFGFVREGVKRRAYLRGSTPIDMIMMAWLKE